MCEREYSLLTKGTLFNSLVLSLQHRRAPCGQFQSAGDVVSVPTELRVCVRSAPSPKAVLGEVRPHPWRKPLHLSSTQKSCAWR